jgi:hypothetical protein
MNILELERALGKYVPSDALEICIEWIVKYKIGVRITRSRNTKFGDYRPPQNGRGHRISINHDLNQYASLLTFTHEVAHLVNWVNSKYYTEPHGTEWKATFRKLMVPFFRLGVFPDDLVDAINSYLNNPSASSCSDINLMRALARYDASDNSWSLLEEIDQDAVFMIRSGRIFIKGKRLLKNFSCICIKTRHKYVINPITEVKIVDIQTMTYYKSIV